MSSIQVIDKQTTIIENFANMLVSELQHETKIIHEIHELKHKATSYEYENADLLREKEVLIFNLKKLLMTKLGMSGNDADILIENVLIGEGISFDEEREESQESNLSRGIACKQAC